MVIAGTIGVFVTESGQGPVNAAFFRCGFGASALALICLGKGHLSPARWSTPQLGLAALGGLCLVANWVALFTAYRMTSIGFATVAYHTEPTLLLLLSAMLLRESISKRQFLYSILSLSGLAMQFDLVRNELVGWSSMAGVCCAVTAALFYAFATMLARRTSAIPAPLAALVQTTVGTLVLAPLVSFDQLPTQAGQWAWLFILGGIHTALMYGMIYFAAPRLSSSMIGGLSYLYPVVAAVLDFICYGRNLTALQLCGFVLILLGGYWVSVSSATPSPRGAVIAPEGAAERGGTAGTASLRISQ